MQGGGKIERRLSCWENSEARDGDLFSMFWCGDDNGVIHPIREEGRQLARSSYSRNMKTSNRDVTELFHKSTQIKPQYSELSYNPVPVKTRTLTGGDSIPYQFKFRGTDREMIGGVRRWRRLRRHWHWH